MGHRGSKFRVVAWVLMFMGCGTGAGSSLGAYTNGIVATSTTQANSCSALPIEPGWTDAVAAGNSGVPGDTCSLTSGLLTVLPDGVKQVGCFSRRLLVQRETNATELVDARDPACPDNVDHLLPPLTHDGACVRRCNTMPDGFRTTVTCVDAVESTRSLEAPWSLSSDVDCAALLEACPQNGDACVGEAICRGWSTNRGSAANQQGLLMLWCAEGSLRMADAVGAP